MTQAAAAAAPAAAAEQDRNWLNVGNWHWKTKDCLPFAQEFFARELKAAAVCEGGVDVAVTDVSEVAGDCSLNVRKGKLITIYDLKLDLKWSAKDASGLSATGRATVPEVAHDTDDHVFDVTVDDDTRAKDTLRRAVKTALPRLLAPLFERFPRELTETQAGDVYIEGAVPSAQLPKADLEERKRLAADPALQFRPPFADGGVPVSTPAKAASASAPATKKPPSSTATAAPAKASTIAKPAAKPAETTGELTLRREFVCSAADLAACFTDAGKLRHWTQGSGTTDPRVGGAFRVFGSVHAEFTAVDPPNKLALAWRLAGWDKDSAVELAIEQQDNGARLTVRHRGFPVAQRGAVESHWAQVCNQIKMCFGYGAFF